MTQACGGYDVGPAAQLAVDEAVLISVPAQLHSGATERNSLQSMSDAAGKTLAQLAGLGLTETGCHSKEHVKDSPIERVGPWVGRGRGTHQAMPRRTLTASTGGPHPSPCRRSVARTAC
jgi:hypothetical protein